MDNTQEIKKRIYSVIPIGTYQMIEFLKLLDIRFTTDVPSAAITCTYKPELLLNKDFIDKYCKTNEHLFMLLMHELYHTILGHTHLFQNHTYLDNIAFDAVINAILCRRFPKEEYISFFKELNNDSDFPSCLLRPIGDNTPIKFIPLLNNLYNSNKGTYYEVYECIIKELNNILNNTLEKDNINYVLIGNHNNIDNTKNNNMLLNKLLDDLISKWPKEKTVEGRDLGGSLEKKYFNFKKVDKDKILKMNKLLKKAGTIIGYNNTNHSNIKYIKEEAINVIPDYKDREYISKYIIYNQPLLFNTTLGRYKLTKDEHVTTYIYIDVSGSVVKSIEKIIPTLLKPYKNKQCILFTFSTVVKKITYQQLLKKEYETTGGTEINCIFDHYFSLPSNKRFKKILILTDGHTGIVNNTNYNKIKKEHVDIYCGLFGIYTNKFIQNITKYIEEFN